MKRSTLIAIIAVIGAISILAAANLKLKSEYSKGNIKDPYTKTKLAPFKYIKVVFDSSSANGEEFKINVSKAAQPSIATYYSERAKLLFRVSNDTLLISNDSLDKEHTSLFDVVIISVPELKGISAAKGSYMISDGNTDSLVIKAAGKAVIDLKLNNALFLAVSATDKATINVSSKDTIRGAEIQLADKSSFTAKDILIKQKKLQLSDSATLHLIGRSIVDFGIKARP